MTDTTTAERTLEKLKPDGREKKSFLTLRQLQRVVLLTIGAVLMAVALEIFMVPNGVIDGGITGISIMVSKLFGLPLGIFLTVLNLPFLLLGYKQIGKTFAFSTLYAVVFMSICTSLLHSVPALTPNEPLLGAIFGGVVLGVGVGLVIRSGGSLDGTEIVAILVSEKTPFSVGQIVLVINVFILGSAGFVFGWPNALYSMIAYYIAMKMIDVTIEGMDQSKSVWIISDKYRDIGEALTDRLGRGVTYLNGEGGFSGDDKKVIFVVITRLEEAKLKSIVEDWDSHAFVAIGNIHDVKGGRFKKKGIH
ncbi:YitT family protein [Paenibacillus sp. JX-17]|uniref:YitT family protein n=1 Tax=Paenibacillus lacisoli TaxID=3064525 RepID=A0ABT9CDA6_9BACL|nr:YitT family protein [Paenibacillus sp. JX-17]MDO7907216.1 YitT family protein [Paenibacillus sp. JX-17]